MAIAANAKGMTAGDKQKKSLLSGGFKDVQPRGSRGAFLQPKSMEEAGIYVVKVNRCALLDATESWKKRETFIVEMEVVESTVPACPPGYAASWVTHEQSYYYQEDVKEFICSTFHAKPDDVDESDVRAVVDPEQQAAAGRLVRVLVKNITTKAGGDFSKHLWAPCGENGLKIAG